MTDRVLDKNLISRLGSCWAFEAAF